MFHDVVLELECFNLTHIVNIYNTANKMQNKSENGVRVEGNSPSEICFLQANSSGLLANSTICLCFVFVLIHF